LIIAFGPGGSGDVTNHVLLDQLARRSDAVLFVAFNPLDGLDRTIQVDWTFLPFCALADLDWIPSDRQEMLKIGGLPSPNERITRIAQLRQQRWTRLAALTGGGDLRANALRNSISGAVKQALDEVRASYILYYQPTGVPQAGWHPITVTINRPGKYEVRARQGYTR
jgi:hypothetical protein